MEDWLAVTELATEDEQFYALKDLLERLPENHFNALHALISLLGFTLLKLNTV